MLTGIFSDALGLGKNNGFVVKRIISCSLADFHAILKVGYRNQLPTLPTKKYQFMLNQFGPDLVHMGVSYTHNSEVKAVANIDTSVSHTLIYLWWSTTIWTLTTTYWFSIVLLIKMGKILFHCSAAPHSSSCSLSQKHIYSRPAHEQPILSVHTMRSR